MGSMQVNTILQLVQKQMIPREPSKIKHIQHKTKTPGSILFRPTQKKSFACYDHAHSKRALVNPWA